MMKDTDSAVLTENVQPGANKEGSASWQPAVYHPKIEQEVSGEWKAIARVIKARDRNKCQSCGLKIGLTVHHIIPRLEGGTDYPPNLITLCRICHNEIEFLGFRNKLQIMDFKKKRKYIKQDHTNIASKDRATRWQQWVYGGYKRPDDKLQSITATSQER